ncbi:hypothetical protein [Magnetospira sp. QH-2]|uniref:hypothetical protein n=1 Tax=Magnetospira sp. (strain QH-2) TaxID=1288970 RepID=UPI0003E80B0B|nr:hypothetical protein [Magnetospira sp. QH-2]CCQ73752.1 Exported protein of unknown function. Containing cytochrome c, monohaem domain [Magnetospira sp. QH-2]
MFNSRTVSVASGGLLAAAALLIAGAYFAEPATAKSMTSGETHEDNLVASVAAGGRLYDDWARETAARKPRKVHPLYPEEGLYADQPWQTWRCVTCHGWDYKGSEGMYHTGPKYTGIKGIAGKRGAEIGEVIEILTDGKHGYGDMMDDQDLLDVASFVVNGQTDVDQVIDPVTRRAKAKPAASSVYFSTICVSCHGADGRMMDTIPPVGDVARTDPWQSLHKMLNGHPGDDMPALRAFSLPTILSVLAYTQTLPSHDRLASISRGGKLYDDWAKEIDRRFPEDPHPSFPTGVEIAVGSNTWRCVECHGWDYKGNNGIRGIRNLAGAHPLAIEKILTDETHRMDDFLKHKDMTDLANFISQGQVEVNEFIDPTSKKAKGNKDTSPEYFLTLCATCHGEDGRAIRTMPPLGRVADNSPWKVLHRMFHGHPGDYMPAWQASMPPTIAKDVLAKLQTLPVKK